MGNDFPRMIHTPGGRDVPYYIIPFDEKGRCEGPQTRSGLLERLANPAEAPSHIFVFSHGWNNDWTVATRRYERFINGYMAMSARLQLPHPDGFKPLLVGIFWPSTALVFGEDEEGPDIAGDDDGAATRARDDDEQRRKEFTRLAVAHVPDDRVARFYELLDRAELDEAQARELLALTQPMLTIASDEAGPEGGSEALLANWAAITPDAEDLDPNAVGDLQFDGAAGDIVLEGEGEVVPAAAGFGDIFDPLKNVANKLKKKLNPRDLVRMLTVRKMKDRAGTVGTNGVGPLLQEMLAACDARITVIGHSYGAKVVLSAVCAGTLSRPVDSALLLQPAISHLSFADNVDGKPGGYRPALARIDKPILSTFSKNDSALRKFFHHANGRAEDLAEAKIAGDEDEPPTRFAALGGWGPRQAGEQLIEILDAPNRYELANGPEIYGLRGTARISGHSDISNDTTYWALYCLVMS